MLRKVRKQNQFVCERWAENIVNCSFKRLCTINKTSKQCRTIWVIKFFSLTLQLWKIWWKFCSVWVAWSGLVVTILKIIRCEVSCCAILFLFFCFHNQFTAIHSIYALITIGLAGIFISLSYIAKIKDGLDKKNNLWNRFQWLALIYQVVFSYCFLSVRTTGYDRFQMVVFLYSLLDIFVMFSIFAILSTIQSSNDEISAANSSMDPEIRTIAVHLLNDSPPNYDDAVKQKIEMVWYIETLNRSKLVWAKNVSNFGKMQGKILKVTSCENRKIKKNPAIIQNL